jgi:hypothetical protein
MRCLMTLPVLSLLPAVLVAQEASLKSVQPSPAASVIQELGISSFRIDYHRPAVKGRTIWGGLVPYGQVWRAGANEATLFTFSDPVKIASQTVPAGSYAFFAIPRKEHWTLILNRQGKQWGAYNYKADLDVLRFEVKPSAIPHQEYLQYDLRVESPERLRVDLLWEKLSVGFDVEVDAKAIYWKYLQESLAKTSATTWQPWFQAARYCLDQGIEPEKAMTWIETSLKAEENARNLECKARLLEQAGKRTEAIVQLDRAIALGREKAAPKEYLSGLEKTREEWAAKASSSK